MKLGSVFKLSVVAASVALIVGCNDDDSSSKKSIENKEGAISTQILPVVSVEKIAEGDTQCPAGGIKVLSGLDENQNDELDEAEVSSTQYVCHSQDGNNGEDGNTAYDALVAVVAVAKEDNTCAIGGQKVLVGLDTNRNSVLDADEVQKTQYLCSTGTVDTPAPIINALTASASTAYPGQTVTLSATISNLLNTDKVIWTDASGNELAPKDPAQPEVIEIVACEASGQEKYTLHVEQTNDAGDTIIQTKSILITVGQATTQTQTVVLSTQQVFLPQGFSTQQATGDINGAVIYGEPAVQPQAMTFAKSLAPTPEHIDLVGFVAERPSLNAGKSADAILSSLMSAVSSELPRNSVSQFAKTVLANGDVSASYNIALPSGEEKKGTELLSVLLKLMAVNKVGGTVDDLIPASTEVAVNDFQLDVVFSYDEPSDSLVVTSTLIAKDKYALYSDLITSTTSENITATVDSTLEVQMDSFEAVDQTASRADFLFVIDNSGSMGDEQDEISQLALSFKNTVANAGIDYMVGTITTDSDTLRGNGFTNDVLQIEQDLKPGTNGSATERGIYWSEKALLSSVLGDDEDGTVTTAGYPRQGASLSVIIMGDERSQYRGTFDVQKNLFVDRGYRVYSVVDPSVARYSQYDDLAVATFGSVLNINEVSEYDTFMETVAKNAGATSAGYQLTLADSHKILSSSISVTVDGQKAQRDSANGWQYYPLSQSIVFTGSAIPVQGAKLIVAYQYVETAKP
ncbi:DUF7151 family protein [Photobacterium atrarenae]|uniref:VWA domain-containing protein n=1 Tax=Photobacterium atrarenae TaxID=865757 RepID=A0ABY5GJM7_9GAMM|nr:VWA domain-containing protein [Photobacterium atrarenae]UTV29524.1 VWA domain-containing protein [Photobacterium atrarenae]